MGYGHTYTCKCSSARRNIFLGEGMMYPSICQETYQSAKNGEYGPSWQAVVTDHPDGGFDCEQVVYKCSHCGHWETDCRKNYYIARDGEPMEDHVLWLGSDRKKVKCIKTFRHTCPRCRRAMHMADLQREELSCQKCKTRLSIRFYTLMWD